MVEGGKRVETDGPNLLLTQAEKLLVSIKEASKLESSVTFHELGFSRQKLRDIYRTLLLQDLEVSLDKKIEQELWNQCYKNPISHLQEQQKSKSARPEIRQEAAHNLTELLEGAYGFYLRLLDEICEVYSLEVPNRASDKQLKMINTLVPNRVKVETPRLASSKYIAQHCLVHLGDIARYRHKNNMADSYYRKAAYLVPSNGQPYNQLAILASGQGDMLSTVFFYLRAIYVKCPFPGSKTNLERTLEKVLKVSKTKVNQKQINKISVLELIRLFLKFHAVIYTTKKGDLEDSEFDELYTRLIGAIEIHLSLGGLSRRQLLQVTFISIVNLQKSKTENNKFGISYSTKYVLSLLHLLIRPPVEPIRHLPSVLLILQYIDQNPNLFKNDKSAVWPHLAIMLNRTLPADWSIDWQPKRNPLPEDIEFKGWTLWKLPNCTDINLTVTSESDQTDARAERILHICRKVALDKEFGSLLNIEFGNPMNGGTFISPVMIQNTIGQNDQKVTRGPPVIDSKLIPPFDPHTAPPPILPPPIIGAVPPILGPPPPLISPPPMVAPPPLRPPPPVRSPTSTTGPTQAPLLCAEPVPPPVPPFRGPFMNPAVPPPTPGQMNPPVIPPPGPPPGVPPPDVLKNLPPELLNILRHIPPPTLSSTNEMTPFPPRFPPTPPFNQPPPPPPPNQQNRPPSEPTPPISVPPTQSVMTSSLIGNLKPNQQAAGDVPTFEPFWPTTSAASMPSPAMTSSMTSSADYPSSIHTAEILSGLMVLDSNQNEKRDDESKLNFSNGTWSRAPGPSRSPSRDLQTVQPINSMDYNRSFFPSINTKPIVDPDSYDRKIESVSTLWDPKSPRGLSSTSQREIWAPITPIRPQTPPTQINNKTPLETMTEKFLESLPNE